MLLLSEDYCTNSKERKCIIINYLLLVVGDDTPNEVGVRVGQCAHQLDQLFLVQLSDCTEHSFLRN